MNYETAKTRLIDHTLKTSQRRTADLLRFGELATAAIIARSKRLPANARGIERARTLTDLAEAIRTIDPTAAKELCRWVRLWGTAAAFDPIIAAGLSLRTLRALAPLVQRHPRNEAWTIRAKHRDFAMKLWARLTTEPNVNAQAEVTEYLRPGQVMKARPHKTLIEKARAALAALPEADQKTLIMEIVQRLKAQMNEAPAATAPPTRSPLGSLFQRRAG